MHMTPTKSNWAFSFFWINLSVAIVVLIQIATNQISSARDLWQVLAYGLIYANLTGGLGVLLVGGILRKFALRKFPLFSVVALCVIVITPLGCLLAQTVLMEIGFVVPQHFWQEYIRTLRVAMPLGVVFGSGALVHALLRTRVQQMEGKLHEKEISEERTRKLAAEAQLRSLESRIHPHFLFNALNSISSLIAVNPERAEQIVGRLASLLRASLDTSNQPLLISH